MKRTLPIALATAVLLPVSIGVGIGFGASSDTECWDEYNTSGTRFYRTVVPKGQSPDDCTPATTCHDGYNARGRKNRIYVPHGADPATACQDAPTTTLPPTTVPPTTPPTDPPPPPPSGDRFETLPVGAQLPSGADCAARVRPMTENRPENADANRRRGSGTDATYPRVDGDFVGSTDEIIQWAACKWGIDEDWVRAQIVNESYWRQPALGDFTTDPNACIPGFPIGNYPPQYNGDRDHVGECPESVGLGQVRWLYHQSAFVDANAVDSTAYNLDYTYAHWRACFEGDFQWLNQFEPPFPYAAGDARGCLGVWFSGRWYTDAAVGYLERFDQTLADRTWDRIEFPPAFPLTTPPPTLPPETTAPPTTAPPTTAPPTTAPPTTAPPTTAPPTTAPPTTAPPTPPPSGVRFIETFDTEASLSRFDMHVFHRNMDVHNYSGWGGGTWTGDHDESCGSPDSQRDLRYTVGDSQATRIGNSIYWCRGHMMTAMGDVDGYSIVAFSPKQVFDDVSSFEFEVNLTDLGNRQWLKFGVLSVADCPALDISCMYSDVPAADVGTDLQNDGRLIVSWSGVSAGYPGGLLIGDTGTWSWFSAGTDKRTRWPISVVDNDNGTVTVNLADVTETVSGSFPQCPCRVVFYDHNYTPDKNEWGPGVQYGYTFHWDNIVVR